MPEQNKPAVPAYVMPPNGAEGEGEQKALIGTGSKPVEKDRHSPAVAEETAAAAAMDAVPGWNQYRGTEAHGVPLDAEIPVPERDDWQDDVTDELDRDYVDTIKLREVEPIPTVEVWNPEPRNRCVARLASFTLPDGSWTQIATYSPRRRRVRLLVTAFGLLLTHDNNANPAGMAVVPVGTQLIVETNDPLPTK